MYEPVAEHVWVPGVPARDLTVEEVERYGGARVLRGSGCYRLVEVVEGAESAEE